MKNVIIVDLDANTDLIKMEVFMKKRQLYYILFFIFLIITSLMSTIYRSYVYNNNIKDYGLADIFPNIGAVLAASFLFMARGRHEKYKDELIIILGAVLGFIIYEFIQIVIPIGTFDWNDIIGTIIGGIITFLIHKIITKRFEFKDSISSKV